MNEAVNPLAWIERAEEDYTEEAGILIPVGKKALNSLNDYSVRVRYPGDSPSIADFVKRFVNLFYGVFTLPWSNTDGKNIFFLR